MARSLENRMFGVPEDPIEQIAKDLGFKGDAYYTAGEWMLFHGMVPGTPTASRIV